MIRLLAFPTLALLIILAAALGIVRLLAFDHTYFAAVRAFITQDCHDLNGACLLGVQLGSTSLDETATQLQPHEISENPTSNFLSVNLQHDLVEYVNFYIDSQTERIVTAQFITTITYGDVIIAIGDQQLSHLLERGMSGDIVLLYGEMALRFPRFHMVGDVLLPYPDVWNTPAALIATTQPLYYAQHVEVLRGWRLTEVLNERGR